MSSIDGYFNHFAKDAFTYFYFLTVNPQKKEHQDNEYGHIMCMYVIAIADCGARYK